MFSKLIVFSGLLVVVLSAGFQEPVPIISESNEVNPDGSFQWHYQSGDGSSQQQAGQQKKVGKEEEQVVQGTASWVDPQGGQHQVNYVADGNGYQPQSSDVPVGDGIPDYIQRALDWNIAHPEEETQQ